MISLHLNSYSKMAMTLEEVDELQLSLGIYI